MGLLMSKQDVMLRAIVTKDKPREMLKISPKGTVPILIFEDETLIDESLDIMIWALKKNDPKDLLYAIMNDSPKELPTVSLKNTMSSADLLKVIEIELRKSNLKVDPKVILAEVESTINDDFFQNNFLKSLKRRITNVATAVASRNN
jgi:hypothetical protein